MDIEKDLKILYGAVKRAVVVWGLSFFGNAITQNFDYKSSFIIAGLYLFLELARKYGVELKNKKKELHDYHYLLFP